MLNEPVLKKKNILNRILNNQILITCFTSILMIIVIVGSSYALFNKEAVLTNDVIVKSGSLEVVISNTTERIELDYTTLGVDDEVGLTYNPYSFSIENTGENDILYYEVRIVDKEHEISTLPHKSLNFSIQKDSGGYSLPTNLGDNGSYIAGDFNLSVGEKHLYDLKLWINTEFGEYANNKTLNASIEVILYSELPLKNNIIYNTQGGSFVSKTNINTNKVSNVVPSMEGYDFCGWATSHDSKVVEYKKEEEIDLSKGQTLYAVWKVRNVMNVFTDTIKNQAPNVTKIFFIDETTEEIDKRYAASSIKDDLTYNNQGRVLGWMETDPDDNTKYHLYVGSDGTTYLRTGNNLFSDNTSSKQFTNLNSIEFNNINTSLVTEMNSMFSRCQKLVQLDLSNFNTSMVMSMASMFYYCQNLEIIELSNFDTKNVIDMGTMFGYCRQISSLDLKHFDTSNVTDISGMFMECDNLNYIDLSSFDTSETSDIDKMFQGCRKLSSLDLNHFNITKCSSLYHMFENCVLLREIYINEWDVSNINDFSNMFSSCRSLSTIELNEWNTQKVTNMSGMFNGCYNLSDLDISNFNTSNVTNMSSMFYECRKLNSIGHNEDYVLNLGNIDTSNVTNMSSMFYNCRALQIHINKFNTSKVTNMYQMFRSNKIVSVGAGSEYDLDISSFNTTSVKKMSGLFFGCAYLENVDLSLFDTEQVTDMSSMFRDCSKLTILDLSNFNSANVTSMTYMFYGCTNLFNLNITSFNTSKVTSMYGMFLNCSSLTNLDLSMWNTESLTDIGKYNSYVATKYGMFYGCSSLMSLDISSFDFNIITTYNGAFEGMLQGATIYVKDELAQNTILGIDASYRPTWTTANVIVKSTT